MDGVRQLYPTAVEDLPLVGLFLNHDLRSLTEGGPFVYSDYITSLDGRIAIADEAGEQVVPKAIQNARDWRLFQELVAQADILFTSGRYLRKYDGGKMQEILQVHEDERFADLVEWRANHALPPLPDMAVISKSADFPIPPQLTDGGRRVIVVTTQAADPGNLAALSEKAHVIIAGQNSVNGGALVDSLFEMGYRLMYNATGPQVLRLLLAAGRLDRLYLTRSGRILGGDSFSTIVEGRPLPRPLDFRLSRLYFDPHALGGVGQSYEVFDRFDPGQRPIP